MAGNFRTELMTYGTALALAAAWPTTLIAYENPACGYGEPSAFEAVADTYVGDWNMLHQSGFVIAGGMTIPYAEDPDGPETMTLFRQDGALVVTHPLAQEPLVLEWADEPVWEFQRRADQDGVPAPLLSATDIETVTGCSNDKMARLIGETTVVMDGVPMDFTYRLIVLGPDQMYGIMHMTAVAHGTEINTWRSVRLSR